MIEKSYIYAANSSVIIASITAVLTALSPTISNIINNHHNLKMKRIELYEEKRIEAINNYVSEVSKYIHNSSNIARTNIIVIIVVVSFTLLCFIQQCSHLFFAVII